VLKTWVPEAVAAGVLDIDGSVIEMSIVGRMAAKPYWRQETAAKEAEVQVLQMLRQEY
jgi:hypothetical protein